MKRQLILGLILVLLAGAAKRSEFGWYPDHHDPYSRYGLHPGKRKFLQPVEYSRRKLWHECQQFLSFHHMYIRLCADCQRRSGNCQWCRQGKIRPYRSDYHFSCNRYRQSYTVYRQTNSNKRILLRYAKRRWPCLSGSFQYSTVSGR